MTPQLVDLNADGQKDMVMATYEGSVFLVEGSPKGWKQPVRIKDCNESNVRISHYYDRQKKEFARVDRSTSAYENTTQGHLTSCALVDWDDDGDWDLILGAYGGELYLCMNEGSAKKPSFSQYNQQVFAGGEPIKINGGLATPHCVDWTGNGKFDILCGGSTGGVFLYQNTGTLGEPVFAAAQLLVEPTRKQSDLEGERPAAQSINPLLDSRIVPAIDGVPIGPGSHWHIDTVDYDGDGDLDLLVGGVSWYDLPKPELNAEQRKELGELRKKRRSIQDQLIVLGKQRDAANAEAKADKVFDRSPEYKRLASQYSEIYFQIAALDPPQQQSNSVWLYRNRGKSPDANQPVGKQPTIDFNPSEFAIHAAFDVEKPMPGDQVKLTLTIHIPRGFHIYGSGNNTYPTTLKFSELEGLVFVESPVVPVGQFNFDPVARKNATWLEGVVEIECQLKVPEDFTSATVRGTLNYMMCDEKFCRPPATASFQAKLPISR